MLPYVQLNDLMIGKFPLHPFGLLVATGVLIGTALATWRGRLRGIDLEKLNSFITWMLVAGFIGGHMLDQIFYHPTEIAEIRDGHLVFNRPESLIFLWEGLSSFGGFVGGLIGILLWRRYELVPRGALPREVAPGTPAAVTKAYPRLVKRSKPVPVLPFCDLILSVFPVAWIFGRTGCSMVHDHPGAPAAHGAFLSVAYPFPDARHPRSTDFVTILHGDWPRYDLGILELIFTIILAAAFALTWRRRLPTGTYVVATAFAYAPVRFAMDYLRVTSVEGGDPRYGSLTPAQWCCVALFTFGIVLAFRVRQQTARGIDPMEAVLASPPAPAESAPPPPAAAAV